MGRLFLRALEGHYIYTCRSCYTHLANSYQVANKGFDGRHGKAYLFYEVVNIYSGRSEDKMLLSGLHTVADIACNVCNCVVGWKYELAHEASQKYKEGMFVLERTKIDLRHWSGIENDTDVVTLTDSEDEA